MNRIAQLGVVGRANNVPAGMTPASDVATLSLFGYDPREVYTGRAPLEAAAMGLQLGPNDWAIRCNLVTVENSLMRDFTAGHISSAAAQSLMEALQQTLGGPVPEGLPGYGTGRLEFHAGVSYRNLLIYRSQGPGPFGSNTQTQAPHDIPDRSIDEYLPRGAGSILLRVLMERSRAVLADRPRNQAHGTGGPVAATQVWLWGQGQAPHLRPFREVYGRQGAIISAVDLVRGVGTLIGWRRLDVPGATGYLDTDYSAKGRYAVAALPDYDLVCVHVEAPDEASHEGRLDAKIAALEEIDRHIAGPLLEALPRFGDWRFLVSPDHRTPLRTRAHAHGFVPFAMAGTGFPGPGHGPFDEATADASDLVFDKGHELMSFFLG
jgi:2,3-bisphosphoglycerate-independent phosphoglycerate mutase